MDYTDYQPVHFKIQELVDPETYAAQGEDSISVLKRPIIAALDFIRETLGKRITVNNWHSGGPFSQRGYRPPDSTVGPGHDAHRDGNAFDFDVEDMTAQEVRDWIQENKDLEGLAPIFRMESDVNWCHIDGRDNGFPRIHLFSK